MSREEELNERFAAKLAARAAGTVEVQTYPSHADKSSPFDLSTPDGRYQKKIADRAAAAAAPPPAEAKPKKAAKPDPEPPPEPEPTKGAKRSG